VDIIYPPISDCPEVDFAIGTGIGCDVPSHSSSISVGLLTKGVPVEWKKSF